MMQSVNGGNGATQCDPAVRQKMARLLWRLVQQTGSVNGHPVDIRLSRQVMADYLGITLDAVCRELIALERDMIVATPDPHAVRIQDIAALQNLSRAGD